MTLKYTCRYWLLPLFFIGLPVAADIDPERVRESLVQVRAYDNNRVVTEGTGFVINDEGHVLTNAHLIKQSEQLTVLSLKTGAEILSQQTFVNEDMNLALLHVQGLGLPPLQLSEQGADAGRIVQTLKYATGQTVQLSQGTVGAHQDLPGLTADDPTVRMLEHNAMISSREFGMPLFNECGQVIAMNTSEPAAVHWLTGRIAEPQGKVLALRSNDIIAALKNQGITHTVVTDVCLSAVERAQRTAMQQQQAAAAATAAQHEAEQARQQAETAKAEAEEDAALQKQEAAAAAAAQQEAEQAQQQAEAAKAAAEKDAALKKQAAESAEAARLAAEATARHKQEEAERLQQEQVKKEQQLLWAVATGTALILLALLGWFLSARAKRKKLQSAAARVDTAEQDAEQARQAAAKAPKPAPFKCILEGQDNTGKPFTLSIPALALGDPAGVVLGRSPAASAFIIDYDEISREHTRLTYANDRLYAEDLDTLNGTMVNGNALQPREKVLLQDKDRLQMGPLALTVRLV
ncbi:MAG: FHA domain-containing protein [Gammaproteobacteria bacterium]|nr:FHA domain-containing protein [Gammaproteobacteria bacterium]